MFLYFSFTRNTNEKLSYLSTARLIKIVIYISTTPTNGTSVSPNLDEKSENYLIFDLSCLVFGFFIFIWTCWLLAWKKHSKYQFQTNVYGSKAKFCAVSNGIVRKIY